MSALLWPALRPELWPGGWMAGAAAAVGLLATVSAWRSRRELLAWLGRDPLAARRLVRPLLIAGAAACLAFALHQSARRPPELGGAGADLVMAIDVSRSMDTRDTPPSRLRRAVRLAERTAHEASGVRIGLVLFAGDAYAALPLTQDVDALLAYLRAIDSDVISSPGTELERALRVAAGVFDPHSSRPRQILLLSDGEDGDGEDGGSGVGDAVAELRASGIRVVAVGFGSTRGGVVPATRDDRGEQVHSSRVDIALRRIAAHTGGAYLREFEESPDPARLLPAAGVQSRAPDDAPDLWIAAAFLLLAAELALSLGAARSAHLSRRSRRGRRGRGGWGAWGPARSGAALLLVAALVVAAGRADLLLEGDALVDGGQPGAALALYRRYERQRGPDADSRLRIGNAYFRLGQGERAIGAYLDASRMVGESGVETRFATHFNLGTALLERERYRPALDALWEAMLERPDSLAAKFNYEWAAERVEPDEEVPLPPTGEPEAEREEADDAVDSERLEQGEEPRAPERVTREEAERWLRSIRENPTDPLHDQAARQLEPGRGPRGPRQTW